jgi:hypothetical protein
MDVYCTRPLQKSRRARVLQRLSLAAFVFCLAPASTWSAQNTKNQVSQELLQGNVAHDRVEQDVAAGDEGLILSARLTATMTDPVTDMHWTIRTTAGDIIQDATATEARLKLAPGTYVVEAMNGETKLSDTISLPSGKLLEIGFVLNAGALRILPRISRGPLDLQSKSSVYALSGIEKGKLIAASRIAGRVFNLPAGQYRIKTEFENSNVMAVTDVRVKAGIMSAVDIDHRAGLANLSFVGARGEDVVWTLSSEDGDVLPAISGTEARILLRPGSYSAEATAGSATRLARFEIRHGEVRDVVLDQE